MLKNSQIQLVKWIKNLSVRFLHKDLNSYYSSLQPLGCRSYKPAVNTIGSGGIQLLLRLTGKLASQGKASRASTYRFERPNVKMSQAISEVELVHMKEEYSSNYCSQLLSSSVKYDIGDLPNTWTRKRCT